MTADPLLRHLRSLTPQQLAPVLRRLPDLDGYRLANLQHLRDVLLLPDVVEAALERLSLPQHQVLTGVAQCARAGMDRIMFGGTGIVDVHEVLVAFGERHTELVTSVLQELMECLLLWPIDQKRVGVSGSAIVMLAPAPLPSRSVASVLATFAPSTVERMASLLGVTDVAATLSDPDRVGSILRAAPPEASRCLERLVATGGRMFSDVFDTSRAGWTIDSRYADAATLWLAERGLTLPTDQDMIEVSSGAFAAVTGGSRFPLTTRPSPVAASAVGQMRIRDETTVAITESMRKATGLLAALDATPAAARKTGGMMVRDVRRLAKLIDVIEPELHLWLDLLTANGLVGVTRAVICPTERYESWLKLTPPKRLCALMRTWLDETHVHLAVLSALDTLPVGSGCVTARAQTTHSAERISTLVEAVAFFAPFELLSAEDPTQHTMNALYEAEILGLAALGGLSPVGRALLSKADSLEAAVAELLPAPATTARFQADLTAIVTGTPSAELAALLDLVATRESQGHAVIWRLSAATVRRGFDSGKAEPALLAELTEAAGGALPQAIEYMIRDVARSHGRVQVFASRSCIRGEDESLLDEMTRAKGLATLGLRRIAPTVLISPESPEETLAQLRAAGYAPALDPEAVSTSQRAPAQVKPDDALGHATRLLS